MADASAGGSAPQQLFGRHDAVVRPWPIPDRNEEPASIGDFVRRVKAQGSEFRQLTEESLRKEIEERRRKQAAGENDDDDDDDEKDEEDEEEAAAEEAAKDDIVVRGGPKSVEAMIAKRDEVLRTIESAVQSGLIATDFVSLLLSKDRPTQAVQTLSPVLREKVGIGTLSAGRIANAAQAARALQIKNNGGERFALDETTRLNAQRLLEHKTECVGWQLLAMDRAAAVLAGGRKHLHAELRREETYWSEVVGVHERGWGLSRMPGQRRVLRVKFGFSEAATDLRAQGFAPLRRVKRGHVALDMSALGPPSVVSVVLCKKGRCANDAARTIGKSVVPTRLPASSPLEDRILEARNTVYAQELWRELNREGRQMVAHGVACRSDEIVLPAGAHTEAVIRLQPLQLAEDQAEEDPNNVGTNGGNELAEAMSGSLHLFLAHGHRQHYRQRSVPAPPSDNTGAPPQTYFLLRPLVANLKYEKAIKHTAQYLSDLCTILQAAGQKAATFTLFERPISSFVPPANGDSASQSSSEGLATAFLAPREFTFEVSFTSKTRLSIRSRTTVVPLKTQYLVQLLPAPAPPPSGNEQPAAPGKNPLQEEFPPADNYGNLHDVLAYVGDAVAYILATVTCSVARSREAQSKSGVVWTRAVDNMGVQHQNNPAYAIRFRVVPEGTVTEMDERMGEEAVADAAEQEDTGMAVDGEENEENDKEGDAEREPEAVRLADSPLQQPPAPEVRLYASWPLDETSESARYRKWAWTAAGVQQLQLQRQQQPKQEDDGSIVPLQEIIEKCVSGELKPAAAEEA